MAIFIMNENGDWWEYRTGSKLYILDTERLEGEALTDWHIYGEIHEHTIREQGVEVVHEINLPEEPKVWYTEEELEAEVNEVIEAERKEAYDETIEEVSAELDISEEKLRGNDAVTEIIYSYVDDNLTYEQMINKVYSRISHPSAQGETF